MAFNLSELCESIGTGGGCIRATVGETEWQRLVVVAVRDIRIWAWISATGHGRSQPRATIEWCLTIDQVEVEVTTQSWEYGHDSRQGCLSGAKRLGIGYDREWGVKGQFFFFKQKTPCRVLHFKGFNISGVPIDV